jgi:hypothetical protein
MISCDTSNPQKDFEVGHQQRAMLASLPQVNDGNNSLKEPTMMSANAKLVHQFTNIRDLRLPLGYEKSIRRIPFGISSWINTANYLGKRRAR